MPLLTTSPLAVPDTLSGIRDMIHRLCGICLKSEKDPLVASRLKKRARELGLRSLEDYLRHLQRCGDSGEVDALLDVITTNKTSFFRESSHFEFLKSLAIPGWVAARQRSIKIWCAGCSTGEEPLTLAMVLRESLAASSIAEVRILATDLSRRVLARARRGVYSAESLESVPADLRTKYFSAEAAVESNGFVSSPALHQWISWAKLNLMDPWPMRGPFDAIFCRNVMIYFDRETQARLVSRFHQILSPGGFLFVGHSEGLVAPNNGFRHVEASVYAKVEAGNT